MPNVLVETRGGWLGAKRTAFLAAIQAATVEALRIPPHSLVLRLVEHPMECFVIPHETHEPSEQYTHIVIAMFAGRSLSAKRVVSRRVGRTVSYFTDEPPFGMEVKCSASRGTASWQGALVSPRPSPPDEDKACHFFL